MRPEVKALVKTAIQYPGGKSRAFQEKSPWPLAALALGSLFSQLWQWAELPLALLITLGGLFVPMCLVGKRYE